MRYCPGLKSWGRQISDQLTIEQFKLISVTTLYFGFQLAFISFEDN
jgi:hypothetical protein